MKLGEFLEKFSHNNLIRLHYKIQGGNTLVLEDWNTVSMDWEVNKQQGVFRHYVNNEVLGLASILIHGIHPNSYPEAINIVIEELENQPILEDLSDESPYNNCAKEEITNN
jgi:hypothetical protein